LARLVLWKQPRDEEHAMPKRIVATESIETTLCELADTIRRVSASDSQAFAVLESMIAAGRTPVGAAAHPSAI
jgi:hypothetical protein